MKLQKNSYILAITSLLLSGSVFAQSVERPPQYVLLAFDGSKSHSMWRQSLDFAQETGVKFTYFISGVYFLTDQNKKHYHGPRRSAGRSDIGFGTTEEDVLGRVDYVNRALLEGHEIASHANGHFDGGSWNQEEWTSEFLAFTDLFFGVFKNNSFVPGKIEMEPREMVGFRAPLLSTSAGLWPVLKDQNFRYDTSQVSSSNYWPKRNAQGVWNFPLASVKIAGTGKRTLSMDYNFYVAHSKGLPDPGNAAVYEKEMLDTYLNYFQDNYNGNRAPVHIGHHFSLWNDGAYWRAMKRFAKQVCGLPEVKCVTYRELSDYMDTLAPEEIAELQKSNFEPPQTLALLQPQVKTYDLVMNWNTSGTDVLKAHLTGGSLTEINPSTKVTVKVDGKELYRTNVKTAAKGLKIPLADIRSPIQSDSTVSISISQDKHEILRSSRLLRKTEDSSYILSREDIEALGLKGDLPEAHRE